MRQADDSQSSTGELAFVAIVWAMAAVLAFVTGIGGNRWALAIAVVNLGISCAWARRWLRRRRQIQAAGAHVDGAT